MKQLLILSALCSLLSAPALAQTKNVTKTISTNGLVENLVVPSGKTLTINSGGSIINNGTATGFTASAVWGGITGTLSSQIDLQTALDAKLATSTAASTYQPLDSDLTAIAALTTTSFGRELLTRADAAATRSALGLGTLATQSATISDYLTLATAASTYQPLASRLTSIANLADASGVLTNNGSGTFSYTATSTGGNTFGTDAGKIAVYGNLGEFSITSALRIAAGPSVMGIWFNNARLASAAGSNVRTWTMPDVTGTLITTGDTGSVTDTMLAGSISLSKLAQSSATTGQAIAWNGSAWAPTSSITGLIIGTVELGHATDTTLARVSAGVASIEGATIATLSASNTFTQTQNIPAIVGTSAGGLYLLINGNGTGGTMFGSTSYMPGVSVGSAGGIGFSSGAPSAGYDTFATRESTGVWQFGSDNATPVNYTVKTADGSGTNIAAGNLTLGGSRSTGTAAGGDVIVITSMSGSSGSSTNVTQERSRIIGRFKNLTEGAATDVVSIALASGKVTGGTATVTVWASDGTDHQALTSEIRFAAINKAGTVTATCTQTDGTTAASTGTLTVTYDAIASGNNVILRANATSSLTQTILRSRIVITALNGDDTQVVSPQ